LDKIFGHFLVLKVWGEIPPPHMPPPRKKIDIITLPLIKIFPEKENAEKKKKMWKGDFLCVGTVLGFTNYQTNFYLVSTSLFDNL
jgi:hypothetical protein